MTTTWKEELSQLRYAAASSAVVADRGPALRRAAELAWRGLGSRIDAIIAGQSALAETWSDGAPYVAGAVRGFVESGAPALAEAFLDTATQKGLLSPALVQLLSEQLRCRTVSARSSELFAVQRCLQAGASANEVDAAFEAAQKAPLDASEQRDLLLLWAGIERARLNFTRAATLTFDAVKLAPRADDVDQLRIDAATDLWAANNVAASRDIAMAFRQEAHDCAVSESDRRAQALLRDGGVPALRTAQSPPFAVDADRGRTVITLLAGRPPATARPDGWYRSVAHVAFDLRRDGVEFRRLKWDRELLAQVGEIGPIVVEIERPLGVGFSVVLAFEAQAELAMVRDVDAHGARWVSLERLRKQSTLYGHSALVGPAAVARFPDHDARLLALDSCDIDVDGAVPPAAHIRRTVETLLAQDPNYEPACFRLATLLQNDSDPAAFLRCYAQGRERFAQAEWPVQLYASHLAARRAYGEAALAWLEACERDPDDHRNHAGLARSLFELERHGEADRAVRRAAALAPAHGGQIYWQARLALANDEDDRADVCARIGQAREPNEAWPDALLTDLAERRRDADSALVHMRRAYALQPDDIWAGARVCRHLARRGEFAEAALLLQTPLDDRHLAPGDALELAALQVEMLAASEGSAAALTRAVACMDRWGVGPDIASTACELLLGVEADVATAELLPRLAKTGNGSHLWSFVRHTIRAGRADTLPEAYRAFAQHGMPALNITWCNARSDLALGRTESALAMLESAYEQAPHFEALQVLLACAVHTRTPERALTLLATPAATYQALSWTVQGACHDLLGNSRAASDVRSRIDDLGSQDLEVSISWAVCAGFIELASDLVKRGLRRISSPGLLLEQVRYELVRGEPESLRAAALSLVRSSGITPGRCIMALEAALQARAWEVVPEIVGVYLDGCCDSRMPARTWPFRAARAAVAAAQGDDAERAEVLAKAGNDAAGLLTLARCEHELASAGAAESKNRYLQRVPSGQTVLARKEMLPWPTL